MKTRAQYFMEDAETRITLHIQPSLVADSKRVSRRNGQSMSAFIRLAMIEKLERDRENR